MPVLAPGSHKENTEVISQQTAEHTISDECPQRVVPIPCVTLTNSIDVYIAS